MEAPTRSGSLITSRYAHEFNRDVYTLPNSPDQQQATGCLDLIRRGATMILSEKQLMGELANLPQLDEIPVQLSLQPTEESIESKRSPESLTKSIHPSNPQPQPTPGSNLESESQLSVSSTKGFDFRQLPRDLIPLWHAISPEATPFDLIVVQSGLSADRASATLLQWELEGVIEQLPGLRYRRA